MEGEFKPFIAGMEAGADMVMVGQHHADAGGRCAVHHIA